MVTYSPRKGHRQLQPSRNASSSVNSNGRMVEVCDLATTRVRVNCRLPPVANAVSLHGEVAAG